jgi:hypothetical protein
MSELDNLNPQEQAELETWLASVARDAEAIEKAQDALARAPEFVALMTTYRAATTPRLAAEAFQTVADFAVLFLSRKPQ